MRIDVGAADKAMIRRVVMALADNSSALSLEEIADLSKVGFSEVSEALEELSESGMVVGRGTFFALSSSLPNIDSWAEASGDRAFGNRSRGAEPDDRFLTDSEADNATAEYLSDLLRQGVLGREDFLHVVRAAAFTFMQAADTFDPQGRVPFPAMRRLRGPLTSARRFRDVVFALAGQRVALRSDEISTFVSWMKDGSILDDMQGEGILVGSAGQGRKLYALSPSLGGARYFAEATGPAAFERRELEGDPPLGPGANPSILDGLQARVDRDIANFREAAERSYSWRRREFSFVARFSQHASYASLVKLSRLLLLPPPPRPVVLDVFMEDLTDAEMVLDKILKSLGPPPGWSPGAGRSGGMAIVDK